MRAAGRTLASEAGRARIGRWMLAAVVLGSAVGLGGLHTPVLSLLAACSAIATGLLWYDAETLAPRPVATMLVGVAVLLIGWTVLQAIPLPRGLLAAIASENADVWSRCLSPLREDGPRWATLSLDPIASRVQILRGITYLVVFVGALRVARRPEGVLFLERVLVASALVVAAAALLHPALGARKVFGLYQPKETYAYAEGRIGPLLNTNHLAAYVDIGAIVAFTSVLDRRGALPRPVALATALLLGATAVWTLSRGGTSALFLGAVLVAVLVIGARRSGRLRVAAPLALALVAIGGGAVLLLATFEGTATKFARGDLSKLDVARNAADLLRDHPVFGVGRGAFESTFPKVRTTGEHWVFTHPENVLAQWTTEWGLPVAVLAMIGVAWALRPRVALARSRPPAGAWAALAAAALHNLVDFNSEVPGVVVALSVCAAMVTGGTGGGQASPRFAGWARRPTLLASALGAATAIAIAVALPSTDLELWSEERAFQALGVDRSLSREAFHDRARAAMLRHPAEAYFPFVGALRATVARDEDVLSWAGRALERSPAYGRVHLLLARAFYVKNPSQARLEYRIACEEDRSACAIEEALRLVHGFDDAMELVPDGPRGIDVLTRLADALAARLPATVVRLDRELAARDPRALGPVQRAAAAALGDVRNAEPWCGEHDRERCVADGLADANRLRLAAPEKCEGHALTAELRVAAGDVDGALAELDGALDRVTERSPCARRLVTLAEATGSRARVDAALDRLLKLGCEAPAECVTNLAFAAEVETRRDGARRALALTKRAWERAPERDDLLASVAARAGAQGLHGEAIEAYSRLLERHPAEAKWREALAREKAAAARGIFERR